MSLKSLVLLCTVITCVAAQNWAGNIVPYQRWVTSTCRLCLCQYSWGCSQWRYFTCNVLENSYICALGWKHNGNYNCNIPICLPNCGSVGVCILPNKCDCRGQATGDFCQTITCSYARPCYPGNCYQDNKCQCLEGFAKESPPRYEPEYGCLQIAPDNKPTIGKSRMIISHIRRTDNSLRYFFQLDGSNDNQPEQRTVWSNQQIFNEMDFEFEATFNMPEVMPERPGYVHSVNLGIVGATVRLRVLNHLGVENEKQKYDVPCPAVTGIAYNPPIVFNCTIRKQPFKTLIEHADTLVVTFEARNGGSRRLNALGSIQNYENFTGQIATKQVFFKFDFQVPKHCTELGYTTTTHKATDCTYAIVLNIAADVTKEPIRAGWKGWTDDYYGSGMWMYYLEFHKLVAKDATRELTELNPILPAHSREEMHVGQGLHIYTFTPSEPGMYSVLLEARDISNNSRIARRLVLYDNVSDVELNTDPAKQLRVASAADETDYHWQSTGTEGGSTTIKIDWAGFFRNRLHEENFLLNPVKPFPVQFQELEEDGQGILSSKKFVDPKLDDFEGKRTLDAIPNIHGIVKFEYQYTRDVTQRDPGTYWTVTSVLSESQTITEQMKSGDQLKIWVRGTDVLGNSKYASTNVTVDFTPPVVSDKSNNATTRLDLNVPDPKGKYNYSSRVRLEAYDKESSVRQIGLNFEIHVPGKPDLIVNKRISANMDDTLHPDRHNSCEPALDKSTCFLRNQTAFFDHCWLMVPSKDDLSSASATLDVLVFNQAMLSSSLTFKIPKISDLAGLQQYTGPENIRIENIKPDSFRIAWDQPKVKSCYGTADILLVLFFVKQNGNVEIVTRTVPSSNSYFDFGSLQPETDYSVKFATVLGGGGQTDTIEFKARTVAEKKDGIGTGAVVGVAIGVIALVALVLIIFVVLVRRGVIHPVERVRTVKRAVTRRYRQTMYGDVGLVNRRRGGQSNPAYDAEKSPGKSPYDNNRQSEFYIYGGMDINMPEIKHIDRSDITFNSVLNQGRFATIYLASMKAEKGEKTVVAKTLKEHFKPEDEMQMKAKISFTGTVVGDHPKVIRFLGAVTGDQAMGPFMIYEYCENGTLKDYLISHKKNVSIELQDSLFRFGLDIAKGMEYLAGKGIVHRRLAARNILLTFLNEVRIAGFGPQPDEDMEADSSKQERIPIKWMPPECLSSTRDATEKSDVWSYAVVLWEIFSLGGTPYDEVRSRDLPAKLKKGYRLSKPEHCDDTWYGVMKRCWDLDPAQRPSFADISNELDGLFTSSGEEYYYYKR